MKILYQIIKTDFAKCFGWNLCWLPYINRCNLNTICEAVHFDMVSVLVMLVDGVSFKHSAIVANTGTALFKFTFKYKPVKRKTQVT